MFSPVELSIKITHFLMQLILSSICTWWPKTNKIIDAHRDLKKTWLTLSMCLDKLKCPTNTTYTCYIMHLLL